MAKARFEIPSQLPASVTRPLYAGVGATDRVVKVVRETVADVQKRAQAVQKDVAKTVAGFDYQPQALRKQATQAGQALPVRLQKIVDGQVATAGDAYAGLVKRGETLVLRIRRQPSTKATAASATTTTAKAKTTRTQATKTATAAKRSTSRTTKKAAKSPARSSAKATKTAASKTVSNAAKATVDAAAKVGD